MESQQPGGGRAATRGAAVGRLLLIGVLVSGCEIFNSDRILGENIVIMNETSETIEVFTIRDGVESTLATIEPGHVVATREGELCSKDTWEVAAQAAPSGS